MRNSIDCQPAIWPTLCGDVRVFARVSPEHKLRIVEALQAARRHRRHDGRRRQRRAGAEAGRHRRGDGHHRHRRRRKRPPTWCCSTTTSPRSSRPSKKGRVIYDNIRKFVKYLLTTNSGELWVMLLAPFLGMPLPLLPLQILWINLVTDGLPALALGVEPAEPGRHATPALPADREHLRARPRYARHLGRPGDGGAHARRRATGIGRPGTTGWQNDGVHDARVFADGARAGDSVEHASRSSASASCRIAGWRPRWPERCCCS